MEGIPVTRERKTAKVPGILWTTAVRFTVHDWVRTCEHVFHMQRMSDSLLIKSVHYTVTIACNKLSCRSFGKIVFEILNLAKQKSEHFTSEHVNNGQAPSFWRRPCKHEVFFSFFLRQRGSNRDFSSYLFFFSYLNSSLTYFVNLYVLKKQLQQHNVARALSHSLRCRWREICHLRITHSRSSLHTRKEW